MLRVCKVRDLTKWLITQRPRLMTWDKELPTISRLLSQITWLETTWKELETHWANCMSKRVSIEHPRDWMTSWTKMWFTTLISTPRRLLTYQTSKTSSCPRPRTCKQFKRDLTRSPTSKSTWLVALQGVQSLSVRDSIHKCCSQWTLEDSSKCSRWWPWTDLRRTWHNKTKSELIKQLSE